MTLREKQSLFVRCLGRLFSWCEWMGYDLTLGHGKVENGHMQGSLHYSALAQDLNLFIGGVWVQDGKDPAWLRIGEFWESLHPLCRWGGRFGGGKAPHDQGGAFTGKDSNHISLYHEGRA